MTKFPSRPGYSPFLYRALFITVILCAVFLPRAAALGDFIYMDEGYHAFMASYINKSILAGEGFPAEMSGYKLYPMLTFWLWNLPGNTFIWIRIVDLLFAVLMGFVFCKMLVEESGDKYIGLLLGFSFLAGLNYAGAINSGFKNSFFPAFFCLCLAINLARGASDTSPRWLYAGALTALGILFRETFALFPVIGVLALLLNKNYKALARFIAGGITAALIVTLFLALLRGQLWKIFEFYFIYGKIYGPEAGKRITKFIQNGGKALYLYAPLLALASIALIPALRKQRKIFANRAMFWVACALAPIIEPYLKIGFLYHFSACLPAMAGLCAYGFSRIGLHGKFYHGYAILTILCAFIMFPYTFAHYRKLPVTLQTLTAYPANAWPESMLSQSTTLEAAKKIRDTLPPGGSVASSGFAYFVFPASKTFPPAIEVGDLSRCYIYANEDEKEFNKKIKTYQPDLVLLAKTGAEHSETFHSELKRIFDHNPDYKLIDAIEPDTSLNYGWLGYDIYKKNK